MSDAWDVFTASLNAAELERERMTRPKRDERFGSRHHAKMLAAHEVQTFMFRAESAFNRWDARSKAQRNPYKVREGQWWLRVGVNPARTSPVKVVVIDGDDATVFGNGVMRAVPLVDFHGGRGGYERVLVDEKSAVRPDRQLAVALRALEAAEHARGGAESRSERRKQPPADENTSAKVNPATGHVASNKKTSERRAA